MTKFTLPSAEADYTLKVYRAHRDLGCWECVFLNGPRQGAIYVLHEDRIRERLAADRAAKQVAGA